MFSVTSVVPPIAVGIDEDIGGGTGGGMDEDVLTTMVVPGGGRFISISGVGTDGQGELGSGKGSISTPKQISARVLNLGPSVSR